MLISDRGDDRDGVMSPGDCQDDLDVTAEITEIPDITRALAILGTSGKKSENNIFCQNISCGGSRRLTDVILWVARTIVRLILTDC